MAAVEADLLIVNGTVVTSGWSGPADVLVVDGRVAALSQPGAWPVPATRRTIDASGCFVMPGGVDPHCHIAVPLGEFVTLDGFASASMAALAGGTTTIVDFAIPVPGEDPRDALRSKLQLAADSRCDFALHGCIADDGTDVPRVVQDLVEDGVRTIKLFTTYRDLLMVGVETVEAVMRALKPHEGLTYVHAEANDVIERAQQEAAEHHRIDATGMAGTRPVPAEEAAVAAVLAAAERAAAPVYFVHQSTPGAVDMVTAARRSGTRAFSESCPHYLALTDEAYSGPYPERFVCCPPLRDKQSVQALGLRVARGQLHTVGSDHCCYDTAQKLLRKDDVRLMPNGLPGVETRLGVVWDEFVNAGKMTPEAFVALVAANPARLNGLYPRKGSLEPGADADIVIFDPSEVRTISSSELHMHTDYTPYEGRTVRGWPTTVVSGGAVVLDDGKLIDPGPVGRFQSAGPITLQ
jgi:dihydropyrimidinase